PPSWWYTSEDRRHHAGIEIERARRRLKREAVRDRGEARTKRELAKRLMREDAEQVVQIFEGRDGTKHIVLRAERDLAGALGDIVKGVFLTWKGDQVSTNDEEETWNVRSLRVVDRPPQSPIAGGS
ncbi:MAG: hypothetical protein SYC29_12230, partial [Planctomycetota bacterium]|nr:hypothetical protein [Planctomycetota bacterium]